MKIDDIYSSGIAIVNYKHEYNELIFEKLLEQDINLNVSIFYEKIDTTKAIRDLNYIIGNYNASDNTSNIIDSDIVSFTANDAKFIRRELNINAQELYHLYVYINVYCSSLKQLEFDLNRINGLLQSNGLITRKMNFRQLEIFNSMMPIANNPPLLKQIARRNILTDGLIATYPFISSLIIDEDGIFNGINISNDSLVLINRFDQKYKNSNMVIFGSSGSGKSFYNKLLILRNSLYDIDQFVIDIENEYVNLANNLNGTIVRFGSKSNSYLNILDIRSDSLEEGEQGYLSSKISKLMGFFSLILDELTREDKALIETKLISVYKQFGITFDDNSLYINKNFITTFPLLEDVYKEFEKDENTHKFLLKLKPFVYGHLSFFNHKTNVELSNNLIIANIYDLDDENIKYGMFLFADLFWDKIKADRDKKKIIYFDEIWRLIGVTSNKEVASFIFKIFKTIRKYGRSAVAITQDVYDIFSLDNGAYGRSVLSNSEIKCFFSLEEESIKILSQNIDLTNQEMIKIKSQPRGHCVMFVGNNHIMCDIMCSNFEKDIIEKKYEDCLLH